MAFTNSSVPFFRHDRPAEVIADGKRLDGRDNEEFRTLFLNCGTISQASGSSYVELGSTKVMVGVYGPRQSDRWMKYSEQGSLDCDVRLATFATRQRGRPIQTQLEKELSAQLETALSASVLLHTFPKAVLDVQCLVLEAGGSVLAAVIAAATLALADASIELRDLVSAASVSRVQGIQLLDPTAEEEYREEAGLVLSFMPCLNQITSLTSHGVWSKDELRDAVELAMGACEEIDAALRDQLVQNASQRRDPPVLDEDDNENA
ncbi:hypothetical protein ACKKBG_A11975 [Auxenochlorella protothecoides x Auxenochlorella symbiontica]|uniref:Exosome complex component MTR3 n=1 Tax=Auxenochlorella protothecoides TaxID=3075 RepID=A0A087SCW9_AUXPR|nr:Exosome complex component MTR3 [Auxenochlorella protothecoides]KFM23573.1 Exosome complex component MTR3 [Auxenochlorella protothecoides]